MTVGIITDSTACIPDELVERYGIEVVPLNIIFGGRTFVDSLSDTAAFYDVLRTSTDRPTTAAPSPGKFVEAIGRAASRSDALLCITVSKQFSAMYDAARQAIDLVKAESPSLDVRLFDSRNAAMAQGFIALEAARLAASGARIEDVEARAESMTTQVTLLAVLDTLTYLARSGRVPRVAAWAAGMLQVKPIVRFRASDIKLAARTRTRRAALDRLAAMVIDDIRGKRAHIAVHHANAPEDAAALHGRIIGEANVIESYVTEFTQVMAVHTGPGLTGVAWWCE
jgi:DegV family protein with EDD domain